MIKIYNNYLLIRILFRRILGNIRLLFLFLFLLFFITLSSSSIFSVNIYVDPLLFINCTSGNYNNITRDCTGTSGNAFTDIQSALNNMSTGDDIYIRGGHYDTGFLQLPNDGTDAISGTPDDWCSIQSYPSEWAIINGSSSTNARGYVIGACSYSATAHGCYAWNHRYWKFERLEITGGNHGFGLWINKGPFIVRNCYIHDNLDPQESAPGAGMWGGIAGARWEDSLIEYNYLKDNGCKGTSFETHSAQICVYSDYKWDSEIRPEDPENCLRNNTIRYNLFVDTGNYSKMGIYQKARQALVNLTGLSTEVDVEGWGNKNLGDDIHHNIFVHNVLPVKVDQSFAQVHHNIALDVQSLGGVEGIAAPPTHAEAMTAITVYNNYLDGGGLAADGGSNYSRPHPHIYWYNNILDKPIANHDVPVMSFAYWLSLPFVPDYDRINIKNNYIYSALNNYDVKMGKTSGVCSGVMNLSVFNICDNSTNYKKVSSEGVDSLYKGVLGNDRYKIRLEHNVSSDKQIQNAGVGGNHPYLDGVSMPSYVGPCADDECAWVDVVMGLKSLDRNVPICEAVGENKCYYIATNGNDSNNGSFEAPWETFKNAVSSNIKPGDYIYARGGVYTKGTDIYAAEGVILPLTVYSNFVGNKSNPVTYKSYPGELAILDGGWINNTVKIETTDKIGIIIEDFEIRNSYFSGISMSDCPSGITIRNNHIYNTTGPEGGNIGGVRMNCAENILIENNEIHSNYIRAAPDNHNNANIFLFTGTTNITVRNNTLYDSVHGLWYKHSGYGTSRFEHNRIYDVDNGFSIASDNITMNNNILWNISTGFAIHDESGCENCTRNALIDHNTVANCEMGYSLHRGGALPGAISTRIDNNIFYNVTKGFWVWHYGSDEDFLNNTADFKSNNNVFYNSMMSFSYFGSETFGNLGNLTDLNGFKNYGFEINSIEIDPMFADVSNADFRLAEGSPACAAGTGGSYVGALSCGEVIEEIPICEAVSGKCIYVSLSGNDSNNGSFEYPVQSIQEGVDKLKTAGPGSTLYMRGGVYTDIPESMKSGNLIRGFRIEELENANFTHWYTIKSYPEEWAIIDGNESISNRSYGFVGTTNSGGQGYIEFSNFEIRNVHGKVVSGGISIRGGPYRVRYMKIVNNTCAIGNNNPAGIVFGNGVGNSLIEHNYFKGNGFLTPSATPNENSANLAFFSDYKDWGEQQLYNVNNFTTARFNNTVRYNIFDGGDGPNKTSVGFKHKNTQFLASSTYPNATPVDVYNWSHLGDKIYNNIFLNHSGNSIYWAGDFGQIYNNIAFASNSSPYAVFSLGASNRAARNPWKLTVYNNYIYGALGISYTRQNTPERYYDNYFTYNNIIDSSEYYDGKYDISFKFLWSSGPLWDYENLLELDNNYFYRSGDERVVNVLAMTPFTFDNLSVEVWANNNYMSDYNSSDVLLKGDSGIDRYKFNMGHKLNLGKNISNGGASIPHPYLEGVQIPSYVGPCADDECVWVDEVMGLKNLGENLSISCTPNLINTSWSIWSNQSLCQVNDLQLQIRNLTQYDNNNCNNISNQTFTESQNISCDYCKPTPTNTTWSNWEHNSTYNSTHKNESRYSTEYDSSYFSCYKITNLPLDLWYLGLNKTHFEHRIVPIEFISIEFNHSTWDNRTTNFSKINYTNLQNLTNITFSNPYGEIKFKENLNISRSLNLDKQINVSQNYIYVNSTNLPEFNKSAILTLNNLSFTNPRILKDGVLCSVCTILNYSNKTLTFEVTSFSEYIAEETPVIPVTNPEPSTTKKSTGGGGGGGGYVPSINQEDNNKIQAKYYKIIQKDTDFDESSFIESIITYTKNKSENQVQVEFVQIVDDDLINNNSLIYESFNLELLLQNNSIIKSELEFKVDKVWIETNDINSSDIQLKYKEYDNTWKLADIEQTSEDDDFLYFKSTVVSLGQFVVIANKIEQLQKSEEPIENKSMQNNQIVEPITKNNLKIILGIISILIAILSIGGISYYMKTHHKKVENININRTDSNSHIGDLKQNLEIQNIRQYLFMYKDTYSINSLKEQLIKSGYDKNLVEEVAKEMGKNGYNIH